MTLIWLAVALAFAVAEMLTLAFFAVFAVVGALAGALAAATGLTLAGQVVAFAVVSVLGMVAARPVLMGYLQRRRTPEVISGAQSMIGMMAPVVDEVTDTHRPGHVRITGETWPAITESSSPIPAGSTVKVVGLRNATLLVTAAGQTTLEE